MMCKPGTLEVDLKMALEAFPPAWVHPMARGAIYLTDAELKVMRLVGLGMTNKEIGAALFISPLTVRTHVKHIHAKTGVRGRARLAVVAYHIFDRGLDREKAGVEKREQAMRECRESRRKAAIAEMAQ